MYGDYIHGLCNYTETIYTAYATIRRLYTQPMQLYRDYIHGLCNYTETNTQPMQLYRDYIHGKCDYTETINTAYATIRRLYTRQMRLYGDYIQYTAYATRNGKTFIYKQYGFKSSEGGISYQSFLTTD